jgi:hypothetical protein
MCAPYHDLAYVHICQESPLATARYCYMYMQRPDIYFIWGYYILSISRPKKRILYPITITAKKGYGYISYILCQKFACIVTVSEQQKARPGSTAVQKSSTNYRIELKPWSISRAARKWQITAEMAETAVLKEKYFLWNPKSRALNIEKRIEDRIWIWYFEIPKNRILYPQNILLLKRIGNILLEPTAICNVESTRSLDHGS